MSLKFRYIVVLAWLILDCYVLSLSARLNIERRENGDLFDNPNCNSSTGVKCSCKVFTNTECEDSTCKRCRCSSEYTTLLSSNDNKGGVCVKDRRLLFIPTFTNSFLVKQNNRCMGSGKLYVKGEACNVNDSGQRWIWTRNNKLMHVDSLKCLQLGKQYDNSVYWFIIIEECNSTEVRQLWKCHGKEGQTFSSTETSISQEKILYLGTGLYVWGTTDLYQKRTKWKRSGSSGETLCFKVFYKGEPRCSKRCKAFGCEGFVDSAILLTETRNCAQQCLVEKEIDVPHKSGKNSCFVMWEQLQYLDKDEWKQLLFRDQIFTIEKRNTNKMFLQLDYAKATSNWSGLIVKLHFYCAARKSTQVNTTEIKCVVIKFNGTIEEQRTYPISVPPTVSTTMTVFIHFTTGAAEKSQSGSSIVLVIVVCVAVAILILCGILGCIVYKRRRRTESKIRSDNAELPRNSILAEPVVNFRNSATSDDLDYVIPASAGNIKSPEVSSTLIVLPGHGKRAPNRDIEDEEDLDDSGYVIPSEINTSSQNAPSTSTALPGHGKRARNRDIEDEEDLDDSGYVIPSEINTASQNVPSTSTALPGQEKRCDDSDVKGDVNLDEHGYVITDMENTESLEDESGYLIPDAKKTTPQRLQHVPSSGVPDQARDCIKDGDYEPLGERYDHVYQRLLATKNLKTKHT